MSDAGQFEQYHTILKEWCDGAASASKLHHERADSLESKHQMLGIMGILLNLVVLGLALIALDMAPVGPALKIAITVVGLGSSGAASLHTFLGLEGKAASHRSAATRYQSLAREGAELLGGLNDDFKAKVGAFRHKIDLLAADTPRVPMQFSELPRGEARKQIEEQARAVHLDARRGR